MRSSLDHTQADDWSDTPPETFPVRPLLAVIAFLAFSVVVIWMSEGKEMTQDELGLRDPIASRDIVLSQYRVGDIDVFDAHSGEKIMQFAEGEGGFVRGAMPALKRMRLVGGDAQDLPYTITIWARDRVTLTDSVTGRQFYLNAFGKDSAAVFARLVTDQAGVQ